MKRKQAIRHLLQTVASSSAVLLLTAVVYLGHGKVLTAGVINLVSVMLIAFRYGFMEAAVASVSSVACLDFFYMVPTFTLYMREPQDWISSAVFASVALVAGHFTDHIKQKSDQTEREKARLETLYLMSRDIIMIDRCKEVGTQLVRLIADTFKIDAVALWDARELRMDETGKDTVPVDEVRAIYFQESYENDLITCKFKRVLRLGTRSIGALYIAGPCHENKLDPRSVDAIASLAAIALERAHSFRVESNAEAAKRSEQLRSTVLDGLAHAFKTPLATIQSASSGLLEINRLDPAQKELIALIDQEATRLAELTKQVLQTGKLDEGELEVEHEKIYIYQLFKYCNEEAIHTLSDHPLRTIGASLDSYVWADARLLPMALLQVLDNASKYASPSSPITLSVISTDAEVVFSVQNEGSFIAPEERLRIFQRFYRSPGSQHKASGTGIGLSVTKQIAEAHFGRVWVESSSETSTTLFLALPHVCREI